MLSAAASELKLLQAQLGRALGRCIGEYELIAPGDRVMVCMSGGKDSYTLLTLLSRFRHKAPFAFELVAVHLDQGQPGYDGAPLRDWLAAQDVPYRVLREDTYSTVIANVPEGKTYCSLCSRLRRGVLYNAAQALGCTKIALGHHRDDAVETLMLNLMFTGALAAMPPKLRSRDGRNVVIRPLLFAREAQIARFAELMQYPILPCDLCGSQEQLKRKQVKRLLAELEQHAPQVRESMLAAMANVKANHLLDARLWSAQDDDASGSQLDAAACGTGERFSDGGASFSDNAPALRGGASFSDNAPALRGGASHVEPRAGVKLRRLPLVR
jgi:tRNA 2-thiocytidine biosynthesis protein TtcA